MSDEGAEKVWVLDGSGASHASKATNFDDMPRTFFYMQEQSEFDPTAAPEERKLNPRGPSEKVSILETPIATEHTTFYDKKNQLWRQEFVQTEASYDSISPDGYDPWVYRYSKENMPAQAYEHA